MSKPNYIDQENLSVVFSYLIFNVESINKKYGELSKFVKDYDLYGVTNGKIYILAEMMIPHDQLADLILEINRQTSLKEKDDYVFGIEELTVGVGGSLSPLLHGEIPELKEIRWLGSYITKRGNYVWYVNSQDQKKNNFLTFQENKLRGVPRNKHYQSQILAYYEKCNPSVLENNPKVYDVDDNYVYYFLDKHIGKNVLRRETLDRDVLV